MKNKIVVLGAGFAGLQLARRLRKSHFDITLIDQYNFHQFQPLFYQVATGRLEPSSISFPLRKIFQKQENIHVRVATVERVDLEANQVVTKSCRFDYDFLVIATGCVTNFFGNKNIEQYAFPMKATIEAIALRNRILLNFEDALGVENNELDGLMNMVIAGGGPTGVELAGALIELKKNILPKDYPDMDFSRLNVYLLEGSPVLLAPMSKESQQKSQDYLLKMGVHVWTNALIDDYDGKLVKTKDGRTIRTNNLIWTAGVTGAVPNGIPIEALVRGNRIAVDAYHKVQGLKNVFAIGDISYMETPDWSKGHPQLANVAINQAKNLARNFNFQSNNKTPNTFSYKNPGSMATVGKRKAVVDLPKLHFHGLGAWLVWMFLHLMLILSVKNKLVIFINWAISYVTNDTTLRLILLPSKKQLDIAVERDWLIGNSAKRLLKVRQSE
ncbi:MAG: NAD(P)/FAD-dependent oxidoreductase [Bacteroidetes bacterium]|nr:NAD(P)/FAD-dependent oxidoreductase [Bacteroidota bacterium]